MKLRPTAKAGQRTALEERWAPRRDDYYVQTGSMFENPYGVPTDEIVRFILDNPPEVVAQVVFGKYVENSGLVFTGELIQNLIDRSLPRVLGSAWMREGAAEQAAATFKQFGPNNDRYATGVDLARQTDYTVISTIDTAPTRDKRPAELVYWKRLNRVPWESIYTEIGKARALFGPHVLFDGSGPGGDVVGDELEARCFCTEHKRTFLTLDGCRYCRHEGYSAPRWHSEEDTRWLSLAVCEPFHFTGPSKKELVEHLRNVLSFGYDATTPDVAFGLLRVPPIVVLEEEFSFYAWEDKRLQTDALFSLALACWCGLEEQIADAHVGSPFGA